jgi:hypothetical protein
VNLNVNGKVTIISGRDSTKSVFWANDIEFSPFISTGGVTTVRSVIDSLDVETKTNPSTFESRKRAVTSEFDVIIGKFETLNLIAVPPKLGPWKSDWNKTEGSRSFI